MQTRKNVPFPAIFPLSCLSLIACLARCEIGIMITAMFELTRREQLLVAGFVFILLLGLGVQHWRETRPFKASLEHAHKTH